MIRYKILHPDLVCFLEFYPHKKQTKSGEKLPGARACGGGEGVK